MVTVIDGDRRLRLPGALVRLDGQTKRSDHRGVTTWSLQRRSYVVVISKHGFTTARYLVSFRRRIHHILRIYQPDLQWPIYGATDARTQAQTHIQLRPPFRIVWSRGIGGHLIEFPAVVDNGYAYIGNARSTIRSFSMRSGAIAWLHYTPGWPKMASSPAAYGNDLVYHTMNGRVWVLDRTNGRTVWSWYGGSPIESSPIVVDDVDYFGAWNGDVYALDLKTHRLLWHRSFGAKITSSAAVAGRSLFIGDYSGRLWSLSLRNGRTNWVRQVNGRIYGTPAVAYGRVFVPSSTGDSLTAFSLGGRELWQVHAGGYVYSSPAVWGGRVCFGSYDGWFYGVSATSGRIAWRTWMGGPVSGAAVIVSGIAYAGSTNHRIVGVEVHTGRRLFTFPHGEFVPVSGNGMRLLLNGFTRIYAVEPRHERQMAAGS